MNTIFTFAAKTLAALMLLLCYATTIKWHWHSGIAHLPEEAPTIESRSGPDDWVGRG